MFIKDALEKLDAHCLSLQKTISCDSIPIRLTVKKAAFGCSVIISLSSEIYSIY